MALAKKMRLGDTLIADGLINEEQLMQALSKQKATGKRLGEVLVEMNLVSEKDIVEVLSRQLRIPFIDLSNYMIDPIVAKLVQSHIAQKYMVVPINKVGNKLTVAMVDPLNILAIDDIQLMTGLVVKPVVATPSGVRKALEEAYGSVDEEEAEGLMGELEEIGDENADLNEDDLGGEMGENDAPIIRLCNLIISKAAAQHVSDIHVECYEKSIRVRYRLDGNLTEAMKPPKKAQAAIASRFKIMSKLDIAEKRLPQDGRIKIKVNKGVMDLRVSTLPCIHGEKIVMRLLDQSNLQLDMTKLGFEPRSLKIFMDGIHSPYGICLVTGPTGSGKTTSLYSAMNVLNEPSVNIMTAEDPVEYQLPGINQVQCVSEIGLTFAAALRSFLRQDPDIIMVGEIRDFETGEIAIKAALTGHLVLSTLHTNDAPGTIGRMTNMGIEPFMIAASVQVIQAQRLVKTMCKECRVTEKAKPEIVPQFGLTPELLQKMEVEEGECDLKNLMVYKSQGCDVCGNSGLKGRLGIYEVMKMTEALKEGVLRGDSTLELTRIARSEGMLTLRESAIRKAIIGACSFDEVVRLTAGGH